MKRIIALVMATVLVCLCFAACGGKAPKGSYTGRLPETEYKVSTLTFSGNRVKSESHLTGNVNEGTFTMEDNKVICEYDNGTGDTYIYDPETDTLSLSTIVWTKD